MRITKIEDQKHRIHISFDNIIFDGWSMFHLLDEWAEVYRNGKAEMSITLSFRDYVLGLEQIKSTSAYEKDKKYWEDRVETFADAPDLPLAKNESQITEQRFCRRSAKLSQKEWQSVKDAARRLEDALLTFPGNPMQKLCAFLGVSDMKLAFIGLHRWLLRGSSKLIM